MPWVMIVDSSATTGRARGERLGDGGGEIEQGVWRTSADFRATRPSI